LSTRPCPSALTPALVQPRPTSCPPSCTPTRRSGCPWVTGRRRARRCPSPRVSKSEVERDGCGQRCPKKKPLRARFGMSPGGAKAGVVSGCIRARGAPGIGPSAGWAGYRSGPPLRRWRWSSRPRTTRPMRPAPAFARYRPSRGAPWRPPAAPRRGAFTGAPPEPRDMVPRYVRARVRRDELRATGLVRGVECDVRAASACSFGPLG
jgi:hypothetical protein